MNSLAVQTAGIVPGSDLSQNLFNEFISYIDRGERTTRTYITNLRQFAAWMRYENIQRPLRQDILSYRAYLTTEHDAIMLSRESPLGWAYRTNSRGARYRVSCRPNTVAQYLRSVTQFFRWTDSNGYYPNVADNIHPPKIKHDIEHKKKALTPEQVRVIEESIETAAAARKEEAASARKDTIGRIERATEQGKRLYAMYLLAVCCGLRTIELSRARIRDLEYEDGEAWLFIWGKGHEEADTKKPVPIEVYEAVQDYLSSRKDSPRKDSPLFVSTGNRSGGKQIASTTISVMLKQAMKQAGFDSDRITAHSLRHTTGTNMYHLTRDLFVTQKYMRHVDPVTTERYLHNDTSRMEADSVKQLYDLYHGKDDNEIGLERLQSTVKKLTPAQIDQLTLIADAMTR